jgi:hypothetical protein
MEVAMRTIILPVAVLALATTGCFARAQIRYSEHPDLAAVRLSTGRQEAAPQSLGMVQGNAWGVGSCNGVAARALRDLLAQARALGAERVEDVKFRARWHWTGHALCKRFLPLVPGAYAVEVQGLAIEGPAS